MNIEIEVISNIATTMCDEYCKYPHECQEGELEYICNGCPLDRLVGGVEGEEE